MSVKDRTVYVFADVKSKMVNQNMTAPAWYHLFVLWTQLLSPTESESETETETETESETETETETKTTSGVPHLSWPTTPFLGP